MTKQTPPKKRIETEWSPNYWSAEAQPQPQPRDPIRLNCM